jgi:uncharacterized repeat protein (TIGR01451 family)
MKSIIFLAAVLSLAVWQPVYAQGEEEFELQQNIRNLTKQNFAWANSAAADPGDRVELQMVVTWNGAQATNDVLVREMLDQKLTYAENLKLDGAPITGNITAENINIGTIESGKSKTITFEVTVNSSEAFSIGTTSLINTSTVFNTQNAKSVTSTIQVTRGGNPTDVSTGPLTVWMISGFVAVLIAGIGGIVFFGKYYVRHRVLESSFENRTDRKLASSIDKIQRGEKKKG